MTVTQLIKKLEGIRDSGGGRNQVVVDKPSFWDGNGTFNQCDIHDVSTELVFMVDGDGFRIINKDGSERVRTSVVLKGKN